MTEADPTVAYITAGAGGMYCGSCLADNTLAATLRRMGIDIVLVPTYTPTRTDEPDESINQVFFGGINVYLQQKFRFFRWLPRALDRVLDHPKLIRWAASRHVKIQANQLGDLTLSMLRGSEGFQRKEVNRLCRWMAKSIRPRLVHLTNALIAGCAPSLKSALDVPILVTLQGDDVFLDALPEPYHSAARKEIERLSAYVDGFLVHSRYYADHMAQYLNIPRERFHQVRLGITTGHVDPSPDDSTQRVAVCEVESRAPTVGYLARLAPEKGLHVLCDAFVQLRQHPETANAQLRIAGWLGAEHDAYFRQALKKLDESGCGHAFQYDGEVDHQQKGEFLRNIDVLCVPTTYREPKGLYVLEALAAGVPVVQPRHGAFPELLEATGGGRLANPNDAADHAEQLVELLTNAPLRRELGRRGQEAVRRHFSADAMAESIKRVYEQFLSTVEEPTVAG